MKAFLCNSVSFSHFFLNLLSMPYEFLFSSQMEINVYIFTGLIAYLCLALYAAYDTCICTTNWSAECGLKGLSAGFLIKSLGVATPNKQKEEILIN